MSADPRHGEGNTYYLQALATLPSIKNSAELENLLLETIRVRARAAKFEFVSALIEERIRDSGPPWLHAATVLQTVDNYLRSGIRFVYLQAVLSAETAPEPSAERMRERAT